MKKIINSLLLSLTVLSLFGAPMFAGAQSSAAQLGLSGEGDGGNCQQLIAQGKPCAIPSTKLNNIGGVMGLIQYITNWMFTILLVLAVMMIIIAAYHYLFSGGSEEGTSKAKNYLIYTVIAIAVAMISKGVTFIVAQVLVG